MKIAVQAQLLSNAVRRWREGRRKRGKEGREMMRRRRVSQKGRSQWGRGSGGILL